MDSGSCRNPTKKIRRDLSISKIAKSVDIPLPTLQDFVAGKRDGANSERMYCAVLDLLQLPFEASGVYQGVTFTVRATATDFGTSGAEGMGKAGTQALRSLLEFQSDWW